VRIAAAVRLTHPFPSILDGLVVSAVALVAGAAPGVALQLGASMTALQASIGALNDVHDAPEDAGRKPGKPIPAGLVGVPLARVVVFGGAAVGLALGTIVYPWIGPLGLVVLAIGYGYDLLAKGTAWSWLPFAVGIPILPIYGWLGAAGSLPPFFIALTPMAVLAGAALAVANARADLERDVAAGTVSVATSLGPEGSWRLHTGLWVAAVIVALGWAVFRGVGLAQIAPVLAAAGLIAAAVAWSRGRDPAGRERAWEFEAVATALALLAWLAAVTG
jgi:4-hydroxybenzoate polyprenyltransferase